MTANYLVAGGASLLSAIVLVTESSSEVVSEAGVVVGPSRLGGFLHRDELINALTELQ